MSEIKQNAVEGNIKPIGSSDFQSFLNEQLLDPIVKQEYDSLEGEGCCNSKCTSLFEGARRHCYDHSQEGS